MGAVPGAAYASASAPAMAPLGPPEPKPADDTTALLDKQPDLAALRRMLDDFRQLTQDARTEALRDQGYYDGDQWTADERRVLKRRKQPDNVFNRVRPAINGTLGVIKQGASDPRAFPRNPDDEDSADVASKTLRFIADVNRFKSTKIDVSTDYMIEGSGAAIIEVEGDDLEIKVTQIRWEEFFYDPRSRRRDFADARYKGIAKWMYADEVAASYPGLRSDIESALESGGAGLAIDSGMRDRPLAGATGWIDRQKRRLLICEVYYKEAGVWLHCVFHGGGILSSEVSPYKDHKGKPDCPIEGETCYVDQDNNRYGLVRDMRGPQDEINKRRSKMLHLLNSRMVQENAPGALLGLDVDLVRKEAGRPDGVLPSGVQVVGTADMASGQFELLQEAKSEIERMGPNPAILGRQSMDASGRAQLVRQQAGLTEQAVLFGGIEDWELRVYRQMWARARQFWTAPMWVRVTDDTQAPQFIGLNQPKGAPVIDPATGQPAQDQNGQPIEGDPQFHPPTDPATGQPHPQAGQSIFGYKNVVAEMDIDIIVDTTPDTANLQQEQFQGLIDLARVGYPIPPEILLKASSIPNKREIIDDIKQTQAEQAQAPPNPAVLLKLQQASADVAKTTADGQKSHATALKTMVETEKLIGHVDTAIGNSNVPTNPDLGGPPIQTGTAQVQ